MDQTPCGNYKPNLLFENIEEDLCKIADSCDAAAVNGCFLRNWHNNSLHELSMKSDTGTLLFKLLIDYL